MRNLYQIRPVALAGMVTDFDWLSDQVIESLLKQTTGTPIRIKEAAAMFYADSIREDFTLDHAILDLGIVGYARSKGFRIDILPDLVQRGATV